MLVYDTLPGLNITSTQHLLPVAEIPTDHVCVFYVHLVSLPAVHMNDASEKD